MVNALQFLPAPSDASLIYAGSYSPIWVIVSILIAILASYAALNASARIEHQLETTSKLAWMLISAFTLGIGIWAMHFIGMLAFRLPCGIYYDPLTTLISMVPGILAGGVALGVVWHHGTRRLTPLVGSILLGAGIGTMHYTGMAAMRLEGFVRYNPSLFALSIFVAVALSYLALRVKSGVVHLKGRHDVLVAVIMGGAVSGMHYTAMSAAYFVRGDAAALPHAVFTTNILAVIIAITTVFLALAALALAAISRNREMTNQLRVASAAFETHEAIMITDIDANILRVNRAFEKITGYSEKEVIGKNPRILQSGRHDNIFYSEMWQAILSAGTWNGEMWDRHKSGHIYPKQVTITAVKNDGGKTTQYVAIFTDITARKVTENKLRDSNKRLDSILDNIPNMIFLKRASDLRFELLNRAGEELLGHGREEFLGRNDYDFFPTEQADFFTSKDREVLEQDGVLDIPEELVKTTRGTRILHTKKLALRDDQGQPQYLLGISEDITERKLAEQALQQFKNTLDQTLDCVFMFDAHDLRFFYVNEGAMRQVGYNHDELLTLHPYDIKPDFPEPQFRELITPLLAGEQASLSFETVHQHKNGQRIPVEVFLQYIADDPAHFVAIVRDITERQKMDRMKSEFISTVSHELRTPLTSIVGSLGLVMGGMAGELTPQGKSLIGLAHKNSQRLVEIINDILDMEKIESGRMTYDMKPMALMPLLAQSLEATTGYFEHHGNRCALVASVDGGVKVNVDEGRLLQVMANLLSNAAKFAPKDSQVEVGAELRGDLVRVWVRDHGPGVPEEFRARMFQKFSQADSSDTRQKGGSGLGLSIVKAMLEHMQGSIDVDSIEGEGATFYFELPVLGVPLSISTLGDIFNHPNVRGA